uniref:Uncharacterized protein n=1 Tax=Musa acuminata subsp. malaccensis TaxID=214687 RepID=A0A804I8L4_MUSAM
MSAFSSSKSLFVPVSNPSFANRIPPKVTSAPVSNPFRPSPLGRRLLSQACWNFPVSLFRSRCRPGENDATVVLVSLETPH